MFAHASDDYGDFGCVSLEDAAGGGDDDDDGCQHPCPRRFCPRRALAWLLWLLWRAELLSRCLWCLCLQTSTATLVPSAGRRRELRGARKKVATARLTPDVRSLHTLAVAARQPHHSKHKETNASPINS